MLSRRASSPNDLGLIVGVTMTVLALVVLCGLLFIWRWKIINARKTSRSKPAHRLALPIHKTRSEMHGPSAPNSASSYASTFTFPNKNHGAVSDLKDPFHFPRSLPTPPPQAVVHTTYRGYAGSPLQKIDVDNSMLKSPCAYSTFDKAHSPNHRMHYPFHNNTSNDNDSEGWESSYYEASRPPSYHGTTSRSSRPRSHSPIPIPLRSSSLKVLSRKPSPTFLSRRMSQPLDITISTDVHVHIDSLYVEAHNDNNNDEEVTSAMGSETIEEQLQRVRIMSLAPQIPSIYLPSLSLGVPFESFGSLVEDNVIKMEKPVPVEGEMDNKEKKRDTEEGGIREFVFPKRAATLTGPVTVSAVSPSSPIGTSPVRPLQRATSATKDGRTIPAGWF